MKKQLYIQHETGVEGWRQALSFILKGAIERHQTESEYHQIMEVRRPFSSGLVDNFSYTPSKKKKERNCKRRLQKVYSCTPLEVK